MPVWLTPLCWFIALLVALPSAIVNFIKLRKMMKKQIPSPWTEVLISLSLILCVPFLIIGLYGTHRLAKQVTDARFQVEALRSELAGLKAIAVWGPGGAIVDTAVLSDYKDHYHAMIVLLLRDAKADYLTDKRIFKSYTFDLRGDVRNVLVDVDKDYWVRFIQTRGTVDVYLVLLPKSISAERITSLADVESNTGKIISKRGVKADALLEVTKDGKSRDVTHDHKDEVP